jgi:ATPase family associated with various cellular activities (AAA)
MNNKKEENKSYLTPDALEKQEHLSKEKLASLVQTKPNPDTNRPEANFIDLMNWTEGTFKDYLKDRTNLEKFVHNRIIIDGQFLQFCKERNVTVECLYKDSVISWKTDHNYEKFFAQGVFLIRAKGVEFLHAALFHKGNQHEDEISFFIICSANYFEEYIKLRNQFDEWVQERDRSNLHIRVVDGEDLPYTKDSSWAELFLPQDIKDELKSLVENFLSSKDFYLEKKIPWKRGFLLYGKPGNGKTSIIRTIMSEYNFKPVTIVPGANDEAVREAFSYAEEQSPSLLYFEDLDSLLEKSVDISSFLNLMDGISTKNGLLVIATANNVKKLQTNITQRPSRFDRKFEIPLPNQEMAYIYLKRWFGGLIDVKKCRELAKYAEKYEFSYAYLKELYISSMFEALSHNRKAPTLKDIDNTLSRLVKEKNALNNGNVINTGRYFDKG